MQTDEVELFTPNIFDTPSLMTPNIVYPVPTIESTYDPLHNISDNASLPTASSTTTSETSSSSTTSSADVKLSKIEDELKQSVNGSRKPTPSPFQNISTNKVLNSDKPVNTVTMDDGTTIEVPSTADVVKEIEALTNTNPLQFQVKTLINDTNEREIATNSDNIRYDSSQISNKGLSVSPPKKSFLIRSQSHTEPTSPIQNTNQSQSQKLTNDTQNTLDDDNSIDTQFTRLPDVSLVTHSNEFRPTINNGNDQNNISNTIIKQQPIVINNNNNKRVLVNNVSSLTKANTIIIPQASSLNEVTSTDQLSNIKRQRTTGSISTNSTVMNFRSTYPSTDLTTTIPNNLNIGSDDQRKKQIRDSNREAARRCRERRRQYIEQLEGNLEHHKLQIKQLTEKLNRTERENTQLRAILSETKILHSSRLSINDSHIDYANVLNSAGIDLNSESNHQIDGVNIQRTYINRNNL